MKSDEPRTPSRHQFQHAVPTVIHNPEEDMPVLARWVHRAMANQARFWGGLGTAVAVLIGLVILVSSLSQRREASNEAWTKLESAKSASARVEIAKEFPNTSAGLWALLQAATEYYNQGFSDLPANKDVALPTLKKALDLFDKVATEAPANSTQARVAAFGLARTLEARNDLDKAIAQYEKVAANKAWAGTDEAREAERMAQVLSRPDTVAFYKNLYAYKPVEAKLPPGGMENLQLPMPFGTPSGTGPGGSSLPSFDLRDLPPPPPNFGEPATKPKEIPLPADVFSPGPAPAPKAESKGEAAPKS
jgi:hypothetical protein